MASNVALVNTAPFCDNHGQSGLLTLPGGGQPNQGELSQHGHGAATQGGFHECSA
jgi:hypothetical protein